MVAEPKSAILHYMSDIRWLALVGMPPLVPTIVAEFTAPDKVSAQCERDARAMRGEIPRHCSLMSRVQYDTMTPKQRAAK